MGVNGMCVCGCVCGGGGLIVCVGGLDNLVNMSANSLKLAWCVCQ